jgi:hypothetical protein
VTREQSIKPEQCSILHLSGLDVNTKCFAVGINGLRETPNTLHISFSALPTTLRFTRHRLKIDHKACPLLVHRFIDTGPEFIFIGLKWAMEIADYYSATQLNIPNATFPYQSYFCTFITMLNLSDLRTNAFDFESVIIHAVEIGGKNSVQTDKMLAFLLNLRVCTIIYFVI